MNGIAHRCDAAADQQIKGFQKAALPGWAQVKPDLFHKTLKPMTLPGTGKTRIPATLQKAAAEAFTNAGHRGLKAPEIASRTHPENAATVRTAVAPEKKSLIESVEIGRNITVAPDPH